MKLADKLILMGSFLFIAGVFLPWYSIRHSPQPLPWQTEPFTDTVYGFNLYVGLAVLVLGALLATLVLTHKRKDLRSRYIMAQVFIVGLLVFLFIFTILPPIMVSPHSAYFSPHAGIVFLLLGCIFTVSGLFKEHRSK